MRHYSHLLICSLLLVYNLGWAESRKVDSLLWNYNNLRSINDTDRYHLCYSISYYTNNFNDKLKYSRLAYTYSVKLKNIEWQAGSKFLEATPYLKRMILDSAIMTVIQAEKLYKQNGSDLGVASCKSRLADIYKRNKSFHKSKVAYLGAIEIFNKLNDFDRLKASYINLGELYREIEKNDSALKYFKIAGNINSVANHYDAYTKGNIGLVFVAQNILDSAEIYLNKAVEILEPLEDNYAVSSYLDGLAEVYYKRQEFKKAKITSVKSLALAQEHGLKEQIRDASLRLSSIYKQSKEFKRAFFHHKQYVAYRDSIVNEETIRNIAKLTAKYEVAHKQKAVDAEKVQKESYLMITIASALIMLLLLVLVFIVLKVNRERRKSNNELTKQHQVLEKASITKNKFFSILSHDLRSPLATFHGYSEVINLFVQHNDFKKLSVISKEIKSSSANLLDLLDNLLQWGVNQMDTLQSVSSKIPLKDIVLTEIKHLQHVSAKKDITIHTLLAEDITLFVDRVKLSIAIRNLLNNAIKFTPSGGSITLSSYQDETNTIFKITDTGVGMTPVQIKSLYDFNHIESTYGTQNEKGVGLGMQLVKEFVQHNNAQIKVESQLGEGTTFKLIFKGDCENN